MASYKRPGLIPRGTYRPRAMDLVRCGAEASMTSVIILEYWRPFIQYLQLVQDQRTRPMIICSA